jgi:hypothetical protein
VNDRRGAAVRSYRDFASEGGEVRATTRAPDILGSESAKHITHLYNFSPENGKPSKPIEERMLQEPF